MCSRRAGESLYCGLWEYCAVLMHAPLGFCPRHHGGMLPLRLWGPWPFPSVLTPSFCPGAHSPLRTRSPLTAYAVFVACFGFGIWDLGFGIFLSFGIWVFR